MAEAPGYIASGSYLQWLIDVSLTQLCCVLSYGPVALRYKPVYPPSGLLRTKSISKHLVSVALIVAVSDLAKSTSPSGCSSGWGQSPSSCWS